MTLAISVVVPSKGGEYLRYLLQGLGRQTLKPTEVILVLKDVDVKKVETLCDRNNLRSIILEQKEGAFTRACNIGANEATGDLTIFTDDDAIPPNNWIKKYAKLHKIYRGTIACISSRDFYVDLGANKIEPIPDDLPRVKLFRWLVRPWLERPHPLLKKYRLGVYLTQSYKVAHGAYIPSKTCYSLPFRGVNMSFKREVLDEVKFPEHPLLKRAPGNEQYVGLQLIMKGYESVYVPDNPILHIIRESLSRTKDEEIKMELRIMESLYFKLINKCAKSKSDKGAQ